MGEKTSSHAHKTGPWYQLKGSFKCPASIPVPSYTDFELKGGGGGAIYLPCWPFSLLTFLLFLPKIRAGGLRSATENNLESSIPHLLTRSWLIFIELTVNNLANTVLLVKKRSIITWINACVSALIGAAYFTSPAWETRSAFFNTTSYWWLGTAWLRCMRGTLQSVLLIISNGGDEIENSDHVYKSWWSQG